ncbi:hypothetical protein C8R44DRAFT_406148 [Mycena epipterygia]|nr:hypothetical protein C8R44DRAFT_406148 [Mycena epipterygia]
MHQGWMRLRLRPALTIPAPSAVFTLAHPGYPRVHFLPAHLVRDNSSFHRSAKYRRPKSAKTAPRRPVDSLDSAPTDLHTNRGPPPPSSSTNTAPVGSTVGRANSRNSLYRNLLRLLLSPRTASLPRLLDYHEAHHGLRSVRSYNLLIHLAIRHVAYGAVQSLLNGMAADKIPGNLETQKLKIRWFVRSGLWEHAWLQVTTTQPAPIPLPLWLEFFQGAKAGALANRLDVTWRVNSPQTRFQILMQNLPTFLPNDVHESVRGVGIVVRALLSLGKPQAALTLATRYFNGIPRVIGVKWAEQCVGIIDALVAFENKKRGLLDFFTTRRKLNSLLAIHPSFRPTPKTLYLLLGTLRKARQCGTVSWHTLTKFKTRWGPQVENRGVRRRVASYAIIERRLDIVNKVFDAERRSRLLHEAGTTEQPQLGGLRLLPFREIYPRHGYEERLWKLLEVRALKVRLQLDAQKEKDGDRVI